MAERGDAAQSGQAGPGQVRAIARALAVLRALAASNGGLTLSETAEETGLAPSTAHRILTTLESERFVRYDSTLGLWQVGVAAFSVGGAFARNREVVSLARPFLRRLSELSGETANIYVESGGEVVCMAQMESRHTMRAITQVGGRVRMHWSAAGKVLLATMEDAEIRRILDRQGMPRATPRTITSPEAMMREIAAIRRSGFARDDEEYAEGLRCIAAPVFDENGRAVAAVSVSGPTQRITRERIPALESSLGELAAMITREYGGTAPRGWQQRSGRDPAALL
ncbi:MAG: transcriptional regulator [Paracoccaceae bacterium]|nr:MAG: IclR family transcriptional regulator [Alphaproteobacteria bacterium]GIX15568.1 MAG: transcriptional regulator [Paracoccaceae bacterium]